MHDILAAGTRRNMDIEFDHGLVAGQTLSCPKN